MSLFRWYIWYHYIYSISGMVSWIQTDYPFSLSIDSLGVTPLILKSFISFFTELTHLGSKAYILGNLKMIWRPPSLNNLTPNISNMGLTHLDSKASTWWMKTGTVLIERILNDKKAKIRRRKVMKHHFLMNCIP